MKAPAKHPRIFPSYLHMFRLASWHAPSANFPNTPADAPQTTLRFPQALRLAQQLAPVSPKKCVQCPLQVQLEGAHFINDGRLTCKFGDITVPVCSQGDGTTGGHTVLFCMSGHGTSTPWLTCSTTKLNQIYYLSFWKALIHTSKVFFLGCSMLAHRCGC